MPQPIFLPRESPPSRRLRLIVAAVAVGGLLAVLVVIAYGMQRVAQVSSQVSFYQKRNTAALCTFRADLQLRVDSSIAFLAKHPHGIPGIPAATIQQSVFNEQRTVRSLHGLPCQKSPPTPPR